MTTLKLRQEKWDRWFTTLDVNKDGVLTVNDWILSADNYVQDQKLTDADAIAVRKLFSAHAELMFGIGGNKKAEITREGFVKNLTQFYSKNPAEARRIVTETFQKLAEIADQDNDGFMSEDEFVAINKSIGFNEDESRQLYLTFGSPVEGKGVPLSAFIELSVEFALGEDIKTNKQNEKHLPFYMLG